LKDRVRENFMKTSFGTRLASALALCAAWSAAWAAPVGANIAVSADSADGRSIDADFRVSPGNHLTLRAAAGYSTGSDETADLRGTLLGAGVSLHGERGGLDVDYDSFDDSTNYHAATLAARAWLAAGDFELALLARRRDMSVTFTRELLSDTRRREVEFGAFGAGARLRYSRGGFGVFAMALEYEYDDDFERFLEFADSPQLGTRPRIEALVSSFLTLAQGTIDRQIAAGIEQSFGRHALALDLSSVRDAVDGTGSRSAAVTWQYAQSARVDWMVSTGMVDSDRYGNIAFASIALGLAN
jgi:hypothetical protein